MRQHRSLSMVGMASLCFVSLVSCAETPQPSPPTGADPERPADSGTVAQAAGTPEAPPSGEIQERAVPGLPGTRPSIVFPGTPQTGPGAVTIQSVSADPCCSLPWYTPVSYKIQLTAPAPPAGFPVLLNINNLVPINFPFVIDPTIPLQFTVPAGQQTGGILLKFRSIPATAVVQINAVAGLNGPLTSGPTFTVLPPRVTAVTFGTPGANGVVVPRTELSGVPPGGQQVIVTVRLDSPAPFPDNGTLAYRVSYAAQGSGNYPTSGVTGPSQFSVVATIPMGQFPITVLPCRGQPCRVIVTVSPLALPAAVNPVHGILQVNP